jgi:hypothetical protein
MIARAAISFCTDSTAHSRANSSCLQYGPTWVPMELGISIFGDGKSGESNCHCQSRLLAAQPVRILDTHCNCEIHAGAFLRRRSRTGYDAIVDGRFRRADALEKNQRVQPLGRLESSLFLCRISSTHATSKTHQATLWSLWCVPCYPCLSDRFFWRPSLPVALPPLLVFCCFCRLLINKTVFRTGPFSPPFQILLTTSHAARTSGNLPTNASSHWYGTKM